MGSRADRIAVSILLTLAVLSWWPRARGPIDLRWDAGVYYLLGTTLAQGSGYRLLNEPGEIEAAIYPPLLPAIVALHQRALDTNDPVAVGRWLRGLFFVLFVAFVIATYELLRRGAPPSASLLGTFVCALTFLGPWLSDRLYTDLPFALALVLFVGRPAAVGTIADARRWMLAAAAFLLRTVGAALLAAWVAEAVFRRRPRAAMGRIAVALVPVLAWQLYVHRVEEAWRDVRPAYTYQRADYNLYNVTYSRLFSLRDHLQPELGKASAEERARRAVAALPALVTGLGAAISQPREHWEFAFEHLSRTPGVRYVARWRLITLTMWLLGAIVTAGLVIQMARGELLLPLSVLFYLASLCSMPASYFGELPRYLWVLSPLLMLSAFTAVQAMKHVQTVLPRAVYSMGIAALAGVATFVVALGVVTGVRAHRSELTPVLHRDWHGHRVEYRLFSYTDYPPFDGGLEWLKAHASATDVVASTTPQWVYLRTGLKSVFPPFERDAAVARELLDGVPVRYVVIADWLSRERALPTVSSDPSRWRVVYTDGAFAVYERTRN